MKKTIAMLLAGMFTVSCGMVSASAADIEISLKNMQTDTINIVSWTQTYQSVDEMMEDADVNIVGTVISQTIEARGEDDTLYFTHSYVEGNNGELYDVLQTGAFIDGEKMNIPYDVSLLEVGEEYFFSLNYVDDISYGEYYLIAGGTQGIGEYDTSLSIVSALNINE